MILFVFEGERREPQLFRTIGRLFLGAEDKVVCSYGNNIYALYKELSEDDDWDVVTLLSEKFYGKPDNPLQDILRSDISEIYLFFDYDIHDNHEETETLNQHLREMLTFFDEETNHGKLYINYPMVESIRYTKTLPDADYWKYTVTIEDCRRFKQLVGEFSAYGNFDFITRGDDATLLQNWKMLRDQNVCKANYLCNDDLGLPNRKSDIAQGRIFKAQLEKFVNTEERAVSILNSFPIFLYEYLNIQSPK